MKDQVTSEKIQEAQPGWYTENVVARAETRDWKRDGTERHKWAEDINDTLRAHVLYN